MYFFFLDLYFFLFYFFFYSEKIKLYSLTRFKPLYFFCSGTGKKNTLFLLTHSNLDENVNKVIFSRKKKIRYLCSHPPQIWNTPEPFPTLIKWKSINWTLWELLSHVPSVGLKLIFNRKYLKRTFFISLNPRRPFWVLVKLDDKQVTKDGQSIHN